jgi:hypothetical protein
MLGKAREVGHTHEPIMQLRIMNATVFALLAAGLVFCAEARGQDYPIKLHRPFKVGDKFRVEATGASKQTSSVTVDGEVVKSENIDFSAAYEAEETVLEVDEKGRATQLSIKISKLTRTEGDKTEEIAEQGTVVIAARPAKKKLFEISGRPADAKTVKTLDLFITVGGQGPTDDEIFGTAERKKVGDTWGVDVKKAEADFQESAGGRLEDLVGTVKLDSVDKQAAGEVEKISALLTAKFIPPFPPGVTLDDSSLELKTSGAYPVDVNAPRRVESLKMKIDFSAHAPGKTGGKVTMKGGAEQSRVSMSTPVK